MSGSKNALISVYDKTGIEEFAKGLHDLGWTIYASGGTYAAISSAGVPAKDVATLVGGDPILGHRVVTLSREIGAALLADKSSKEDIAEMKKLGIPIIDLVCQDSYPLEEALATSGVTLTEVIEKTDIGGPTMLREAAKGRRIVLSVAEQRKPVLEWLKAGMPDEEEFVAKLVARALYEAARYDLMGAQYHNGLDMTGFAAFKYSPTKYGENPQQKEAAFYADNRIAIDPLGLDQFQHVQGWEKSFVNYTDIDHLVLTTTHIAAGFERNFKKVPAIAVGVKHGNACGAGVGKNHVEAVKKMLEGDTRAIFGGVVMINGVIDEKVADTLMHYLVEKGSRLLDGIAGSGATDEALAILTRSKLRVLINPALAKLTEASLDTKRRLRPVRGGALEQPNYDFVQDFSHPAMQEHGEFTQQQREDMILGWAIGSTSNSNTIVLVKDGRLIGNGVGQQDRIGAGQLALTRTTTEVPTLRVSKDKISLTITLDKEKISGAAAYSDSFFPFADGPELLADAGITAILTSSGSQADETVATALRAKGVSIAMIDDKEGRGFFGH